MPNLSTIPPDASTAADDLPTDGLPVGPIELPHARPLGIVTIALLCFLCVAPALDGGFLWLDSDHVPLAPNQLTLHALARIWSPSAPHESYAPLSQSLFWLQAIVFHASTTGYHAINLLLHIATALLLWQLLSKLALRGSFLAAAAWAVHPLQVQSVAWIANQPMLLASLLGLATLISAVSAFSLSPTDIPTPDKRLRAMIAFYIFFLAAIVAHSNLFILPLIVVALIAWRRGKLVLVSISALLPSIVVGIAVAIFDHHLAGRAIELAAGDFGFSPLQRLLIAARAAWFSVGKLLCPWPLSFIYPRWIVSTSSLWQYTFPAALFLVIALLALLTRTLGRAPLAVAAIVLLALFPTLGFFDLPRMRFTFASDDYAYLAIAPILAAIAHLLFRRRHRPQTSLLAALVGFLVLVVLASLSCLNAMPYHSATDLWSDTLAKTDNNCWLAHDGLAVEILRQPNPPIDAARRQLEMSLLLHPHQVEAHIMLGQLLVARANFTGAAVEFQAAHAAADQPSDIRPGQQIADALLRQGLKPEAAAVMNTLITLDPSNVDLHLQYAVILDSLGKVPQAVDQCRAAVALDAGNDRAWADMANCLWHTGDLTAAADAMQHAIDIGPPDALRLNSLGQILLAAGHTDIAINKFTAALKIDPTLVAAHRNLAQAYAKTGNKAAAQQEMRKAHDAPGL